MTTINKINNAKITSIAIASILLIGTLSMATNSFAAPAAGINFGNNGPVTEGTTAVLSGTAFFNSDNSGINGGSVLIRQGLNSDNTPASSCEADHYSTLGTVNTDVNGHYEYNFATDGLGGQTLVFRSELEASPSNYNHANSACVPLVINEPEVECEGDIQIVAIDSSVNPGNNEFGYTIEVTACTDIENLKIQGGSNGWAEIDNFIRDPLNLGDLDVKELKKNTVYSWKIDSLSENDMVTFEVQMHSLKDISCGQTVQLNGGWSVAYNLPADNAKYKTGYTTPLTWTNDCS